MIFDTIPVAPYGANCYLIGDERDGVCAVVDPGGSPDKVLAMVDNSGLALRMILLTHGHFDHAGGVLPILERYPDIPVYLHPSDLSCGAEDKALFPLSTPEKNRRDLRDGDQLALGSLVIRVLHTPGHSRGSVTFAAGDVLLTGDTLFAGSCGRWDLDGGDGDALQKSLEKLGRISGAYKVCPGHGSMSTLERERANNPYVRQAMAR